MNRPDVSIIIVSWNTSAYLRRCLAAIPQAAVGLTIEVIVVDNGSTDGTQAMLAEKFPRVRVIQKPENLGFGRANNVGARASQGRTILLLNSDCELQSSALAAMVSALDGDPSLGAVFCRLLNTDGTLQPSVHPSFPSPWSTIGDLFFLSSLRYAVYRTPVLHRWLLVWTVRAHGEAHDVAWGGGACLLIRRAVLEATGGFDEQFFMYCEDMDLCKRIREAGYRLRYLPEPSAIHHWGKSTAQLPAVMLREAYKSRVYYFQKHFPGWGGSVARWMALRELEIRRLVFCLLAFVPSRRRPAFRDRAASSSACLQFVRDSPSLESGPPARAAVDLAPLFLLLVVLFSLFHYLHDLAKLLVDAPFIDFAHYYTYATVVSLGQDPFDPQAVAQVDHLLNIRRASAAANYPPLFYLFMQPWVLLPFRLSAVVWLLAGQACLLLTVWLCFRRAVSVAPIPLAATLFVILNYQPLIENLALGQANVLLLFLVTLAWWGLHAGHPWVAAGAVATAVHIKPQYGLLLPLLWWIGLGSVCARALLLAGLGLGAGLLVLGPAHYLDYLRYLLSPPDALSTWTENLSPRATLHRLLSGSGESRLVADGLTLAVDGLLLVLFARALPRSTPPESSALDWSWGLGLTAILLLSPLTEEHHLVVLLLPLTLLLLAEPVSARRLLELGSLAVSIVLLGSHYSFERFALLHQGLLSLLTTGKLLGVVGLAWILMRRLRHTGAGQP